MSRMSINSVDGMERNKKKRYFEYVLLPFGGCRLARVHGSRVVLGVPRSIEIKITVVSPGSCADLALRSRPGRPRTTKNV